jgi:hypothetical protein
MFRRDAAASVLHLDADVIGAASACAQCERASVLLHRLSRVCDQIEQDLSQLNPIHMDGRQFGLEFPLDLNAG